MFGLIWKTPELVAGSLYEAVAKVVESTLEENFLGLDRQSPGYGRYYVASGIFANLLCQSLVTEKITSLCGEKVPERLDKKGFRVSMLLQDRHLSHLAEKWNPTIRLSDVVVWEEEARQCQRGPFSGSFDQHLTAEALTDLKEGRLSAVCLPLVEVVRFLYVARGFKWLSDSMEGATQQLARPYSSSLLMPVCRTLIMQITGDSARGGDETVTHFSVSMVTKWLFLKEAVDKILN